MERLARNPLALVAAFAAAAILGALAFWTAQRLAPGSAIGTDRARVEAVVHDYVLAHPEIIPAAMDKLRDRETGKIITANAPAILQPFGAAWAGNPKGDVTLVEYFDYNCGYCRASLPTIAALLKSDPQVKIVYRELPILSAESGTAARMSLAAAEQGKFQVFHDALYAAGPLSPQSIDAAAAKAGVDKARAATLAPRADAEIASNMAMARQLNMTGTPSWVIGDRVVSSALPLEELQKAIATARAKG